MDNSELWRLTPAQFDAMETCRELTVKREDRRTGLLTCVIRRIMGDKRADVFDLFPEHKPQRVKTKDYAKELKNQFEVLALRKKVRKRGKKA